MLLDREQARIIPVMFDLPKATSASMLPGMLPRADHEKASLAAWRHKPINYNDKFVIPAGFELATY